MINYYNLITLLYFPIIKLIMNGNGKHPSNNKNTFDYEKGIMNSTREGILKFWLFYNILYRKW